MSDKMLQLSKPPIVEAAIRMAFNPLSDEAFGYLDQSIWPLLPDYVADGPRHEGRPKVVSGTSTVDALHTIRITKQSFVFSRLAPYSGWDSFRDQGKRVWQDIRQLIGNTSVHTYGLRYINKLYLPVGQSIAEFLRLYPELPNDENGNPQRITNVSLTLAIPITSPQGLLSVRLIQIAEEFPDKTTFILDNQFDFAGTGLTDALIWVQLEEARKLKNDYFVQFLTPEFLEQYK